MQNKRQTEHKKGKNRFFWTKDRCIKEALKYTNRGSFCEGSPGAYQATRRNGWADEVCRHMTWLVTPRGYWTIERCRKEALKYKTKSDFRKNKAYKIAYRHGWLDEICEHMKRRGNRYNKCVYAYKFEDNSVYIGLTYNIEERHKNRLKNKDDAVMIHMNKTGMIPKIILLTDYIPCEEASALEIYFVNEYKGRGWNILNRHKAGGLGGGNIKWDKKTCIREASKYKTRKEFSKNCWGAYAASLDHGWCKEVCSHMKYLSTPNGYWSKSVCRKIALKYTNRKDLILDYPGVMSAMYYNGWVKELCSHMKNMRGNEDMKKKFKKLYGKTVFKYTLNGDFLESFNCAADAAESVGVTNRVINACCNEKNRHKTCRGFIWKYEESVKKAPDLYDKEIEKQNK